MTFKADDKGKGILLQVAFKGAIDASPDPDPNAIHDLTKRYFKVLLALGEEFEVEFTSNRGGGGGGGNWKGGGGKAPSARASLPQVEIDYFGDGKPIKFFDQRSLKASGQYKSTAPDFNSVDKFDLRGNGEPSNVPIWLVGRDGTYNDDAAALLSAAGVDLTLPNSPQDQAAAVAANVTAAGGVF